MGGAALPVGCEAVGKAGAFQMARPADLGDDAISVVRT